MAKKYKYQKYDLPLDYNHLEIYLWHRKSEDKFFQLRHPPQQHTEKQKIITNMKQ